MTMLKWSYISAAKSWSDKEYSLFDFPAHSMFTFDLFWGRLGTIIFGKSSPAAKNTWSRLPFRLRFCFLWL